MTWKIGKYWNMKKSEVIQLNILDYLEYCEATLNVMYEEQIRLM